MTSPTEFLTKQLKIQKEIVTFRCLSRALSMHVNVAKKELASFYASSQATDEPVHATFLLTGDVASVQARRSYPDEQEVDVNEDELETVCSTKILLVGENELEVAKAQFTHLSSAHIYSLSPSAIRDAALLAPIADRVRSQYTTKGKEFHQTVGVVIGTDVRIRTSASKKGKENTATSSKLKPPPPDKKPAERPRSSDNNTGNAPVKNRVEDKKKGTLDWSKAKSKAEKEKDAKDAAKTTKKEKEEKAVTKKESKGKEKEQTVTEKKSKANLKVKRQDLKVAVKMESEESDVDVKKEKALVKPKRGTKRPSAVMSLSDSDEDNNPSPKTKSRTSAAPLLSKPASVSDKHVKVKRGALISDDEDDVSDAKPKLSRQKSKGKGRAMLSDDEDGPDRSIQTVMDLDDSHFTRHNTISAERQAEEEEEEDVEMASDSEPIPARVKPKRKLKKVIPIGSNGLPKKRVVKSRKSKDARGYMMTQDYSSYESASASEQVAASGNEKKSKKRKKKSKQEDQASLSDSERSVRPKPRPNNKQAPENKTFSAEQSKSVKSDISAPKPELKKPDSNSGSISGTNSAKPSNGGKKNIMNYFAKK